jgi:hypothetical protein
MHLTVTHLLHNITDSEEEEPELVELGNIRFYKMFIFFSIHTSS